jgi:regulator of protease activity HflC (stomatin/prohibitin superfamily)
VRHVRTNPNVHVMHYRRGAVIQSAPGVAFWVWPLSDSVVAVPTDDRDLTLVIHGRSSDYQDVAVQGILTYRTSDPERLAGRVDFSLNLESGSYVSEPIERVEVLLSQLAQEEVLRYLARTSIRELLSDGIARLREAVDAALAAAPQVPEFGLVVSSVRITGVRPDPDLEKAIEAPMRERIKQESDEALTPFAYDPALALERAWYGRRHLSGKRRYNQCTRRRRRRIAGTRICRMLRARCSGEDLLLPDSKAPRA